MRLAVVSHLAGWSRWVLKPQTDGATEVRVGKYGEMRMYYR